MEMMNEEKKQQGQVQIRVEHLDGPERSDLCNFGKSCKRASRKKRLSPLSKARRETETSL